MAIPTTDDPSIPTEELLAGGTEANAEPSNQSAFLLAGPVYFGPFYAPKRISVSKERDLNRQGDFCGGEDVTDLGSKNRDIHIAGRLLESELQAFEALLDNDEPLDLTTAGWSGEVMVAGGEYEGPHGIDPRADEYFFEYSLDVVSTGRDEDYSDSSARTETTDVEFTEAQLEALEDGVHVGL